MLYLRAKGYTVPRNPKIAARTLPVVSTELPPEGKIVVIVTYYSKAGHVSAAQNIDGELVIVDDSVFKKGHIVPKSLYKGFIG